MEHIVITPVLKLTYHVPWNMSHTHNTHMFAVAIFLSVKQGGRVTVYNLNRITYCSAGVTPPSTSVGGTRFFSVTCSSWWNMREITTCRFWQESLHMKKHYRLFLMYLGSSKPSLEDHLEVVSGPEWDSWNRSGWTHSMGQRLRRPTASNLKQSHAKWPVHGRANDCHFMPPNFGVFCYTTFKVAVQE